MYIHNNKLLVFNINFIKCLIHHIKLYVQLLKLYTLRQTLQNVDLNMRGMNYPVGNTFNYVQFIARRIRRTSQEAWETTSRNAQVKLQLLHLIILPS